MTRLRPLTLSLALAATAIGAAPAAPPPVQDWSDIEVVIVRPDHPGPALWHIAKGASEIWIVPTVSPVPKGLPWDSTEIASLLKGAHALLLPPRASIGVFEGLWFWMTGMDVLEQPDGKALEDTLPPPLRARFISERTRIGRDADRYSEFLAGVAALRLESDYWNYANFTPNGPQRTIESLASREGVPARPVATYPAMNVIKDVPRMTPAAHLACLKMALDDIDTQSLHAVAAAEAWAKGDIGGVKAHYSETHLDDCLNQNSAYAVLRETANRDMTSAIVAALNKPGTSVAVMPMGFFLRKGGVLERLQAAGLTVTGPGS